MEIMEFLQLYQLRTDSAWLSEDSTGSTYNAQDLYFFTILQSLMPKETTASSTTEMPIAEADTKNSSQRANQYDQLIRQVGQKYGVDSNLIGQVVSAESSFNSQAVSSAGAGGLMQLMPSTASSYGVRDLFDPVQNLDGGTRFLRDLLDKYQGNTSLALAAYNAGPGAVDKYGGIPPYRETQNYVNKIMTRLSGVDYKT